jgi:hypothetical protein
LERLRAEPHKVHAGGKCSHVDSYAGDSLCAHTRTHSSGVAKRTQRMTALLKCARARARTARTCKYTYVRMHLYVCKCMSACVSVYVCT